MIDWLQSLPKPVGLLTFDTSPADPQLTYETINIDGESVHSMEFSKQMLSHGNR